MRPQLPPAREPGRYRIAMVCLGNICRSPMAHAVLTELADRAGLAHRVEITSAATGPWHVGEPVHPIAASALLAEGYDPSGLRGEQVDAGWFDRDLMLAMDRRTLESVLGLGPEEPDRVVLFRTFDPVSARRGGEAVPDLDDPYGGPEEAYAETLAVVERTCLALVDELCRLL